MAPVLTSISAKLPPAPPHPTTQNRWSLSLTNSSAPRALAVRSVSPFTSSAIQCARTVACKCSRFDLRRRSRIEKRLESRNHRTDDRRIDSPRNGLIEDHCHRFPSRYVHSSSTSRPTRRRIRPTVGARCRSGYSRIQRERAGGARGCSRSNT